VEGDYSKNDYYHFPVKEQNPETWHGINISLLHLCSVVLVQRSEFYFGFSFKLGKDYNFNLV